MAQAEAFEASRPVIRALEDLGVDYLVGGSLASSFHGTPRSTDDVDLVANLKPVHAALLVARLGDDYYFDLDRMRHAIRNRSSFNVIYLKTMFKIDVFVQKHDDYSRQEMRRRLRIDIGDGEELDVASAEDSVLQKLVWYRRGGEVSDRQWQDLLGVLKVRRRDLELDYLERWAADLGVTDLLERALADAGVSGA